MNEHVKAELNRSISATDAMFEGNPTHYFNVGASALANIRRAVATAGTRPQRILDFGCGAGRVTRWIASAFPSAAIEGCDIREPDLEFVARTFGVQTWVSGIDATKLNPPSSYDLIWVGSVFTHLSETDSVVLFDKLVSWLNPRGALVLTSHGRYPASISEQSGYYGIKENWPRVVDDFEQLSFGYADYPDTPGYGISIIQLAWWAKLITSRPELRLIGMTERGWDDHQDVVAVQRITPD